MTGLETVAALKPQVLEHVRGRPGVRRADFPEPFRPDGRYLRQALAELVLEGKLARRIGRKNTRYYVTASAVRALSVDALVRRAEPQKQRPPRRSGPRPIDFDRMMRSNTGVL